MSVEVAIFDFARLSPGTYVMISDPGENPSPWFCAAVATWTPFLFAGASFDEMASRRPVVVGAAIVKASFGHGNRQWWPAGAVSSTSQPETAASGIAAAGPRPADAAAEPDALAHAAASTAAVTSGTHRNANDLRPRPRFLISPPSA